MDLQSGVVAAYVKDEGFIPRADYRLVVIKDCCADTDAELHACLIEKFFPRGGAVVTAAEFEAALASNAR